MTYRDAVCKELQRDRDGVRVALLGRFLELLHPNHPSSETVMAHPELLLVLTGECPDALHHAANFLCLGSSGAGRLKRWIALRYGRRLTVQEEQLLDSFLRAFIESAATIPDDLVARALFFLNANLSPGDTLQFETVKQRFKSMLGGLRELARQRGLTIPSQTSRMCDLVKQQLQNIRTQWKQRVLSDAAQAATQTQSDADAERIRYYIAQMVPNVSHYQTLETFNNEQGVQTVKIEAKTVIKEEGLPIEISSDDVSVVSSPAARRRAS